jgi:hypothetical protein
MIAFHTINAFGQKLKIVAAAPPTPEPDSIWGQALFPFIFGVVAAAVIFLWIRHRNAPEPPSTTFEYKGVPMKERRARPRAAQKASLAEHVEQNAQLLAKFDDIVNNNQDFYDSLPLFTIKDVEPPKPFEPLPESDDETMLAAIELSNGEWEENAEIREQALQELAQFRTQNSVDAISQMALYDLSSSLRSHALATLADFDHESVFETILLACTDPTREVRAAAARALFRLSFDRSDAFLRISESGDEISIRQGARAVIAADLVKRSLDRLTHPRRPHATEGFAIVRLLIKAGETTELLDELIAGRDPKIARAILHVIAVSQDEPTFAKLFAMLENQEVSDEIRDEIAKTVNKDVMPQSTPESPLQATQPQAPSQPESQPQPQ